MEKRKSIFALLVIIFLFSALSINSSSPTAHVETEVFEQLEETNNVRVMIEFKEDNKFRKIKGDELGIKVKHNFGNKISAMINAEDLDQLQDNPKVKKIKIMGVKHISLSDSVPLINASIAWPIQIEGINVTGIDETICIIDTGVNYSHPDLGGCYGENNVSSDCKIIGGFDYCADDVTCTTSDNNPIDVNGHGTHVAGIAGANGTAKGVAPGAKIIMIKASNSTGTFWDDDLKSAIDWCVNNASAFNISVISMSLGGGLYDSYCDGVDDSEDLTSSINNAIAVNISVVVATGNDANYTHVASPACIQNVTAIGGTDKSDAIYSGGNRNNLTDLLAPGVSITSTYLGPTGYAIGSGTSMSAPHVAGAFTLLRQFYKLQTNKILTPSEIEIAFNNSGKIINDASSNLNFSKIDIYGAILLQDDKSPSVTLINPNNSLSTLEDNQSFNCNATDEIGLLNMTFYLWNSTGVVNQTNLSINGIFAQQEFNETGLSSGNYHWNCLVYDSQNNSAFASSNFSLTISDISVSLESPTNFTFTNVNQTLNCSSNTEVGIELSNVTLFVWNSTGDIIYNLTNNISGTTNSSSFQYNFSEAEELKWNCLIYTNISTSSFSSSNFTITYDTTNPNITLLNPSNSDSSNTGTSTVIFEYNVSESNIDDCSLIINGEVDQTASDVSVSEANNFSKSLASGSYNWNINCTDLANNLESSGIRSLTINAAAATSGGGGGGRRLYNNFN